MMYNRTSRGHFALGLGYQRKKGWFNVTKPESHLCESLASQTKVWFGHPKPTLGLGPVIRKRDMAAYN